MKAQCPKCGAVYRIDDSKIPEKGAYASCTKCKTRFQLMKESEGQKAEGQETEGRKVEDKTEEPKDELITCPACGHVNIFAEKCRNCGHVFTKEEKESLTIRI